MKTKILRVIVCIAEALFLLFYFAENFAVVFPGEPLPDSDKVFIAVTAVVNFALCIFLIRRKLLSAAALKTFLFIACIVYFLYLESGFREIIHYIQSRGCYGREGAISFFLCAGELLLRLTALMYAKKIQNEQQNAADRQLESFV